MLRKMGAAAVVALALAPALTPSAAAASLPEILAGPRNAVPECATPGRLMAYLKLRNPQLDPRYDSIATEYMRYGEMLGIRWDFAFYQMIVETGSLSYWRGNRHGDVKPTQNNFAGLGATGRGEPGESFPDIASGVRAHLEHLLLYAGRPVDNPVAQRTRNVREWGVLTSWHRTFTRPITFADMSAKWAPGTRSYSAMLKTVADRFEDEVCSRPDPRPALVQEARAWRNKAPGAPKGGDGDVARPSGADLAQRAIDHAKIEGTDGRSALGAKTSSATTTTPAPFKILNAPPAAAPSQPSDSVPVAAATPPPGKGGSPAVVTPNSGPSEKAGPRTASAAGAAAKGKGGLVEPAAPPATGLKCRVWTASYGGQKAIIIRSVTDQVVNFTVLDVNEGSETREAEAFISAYAKNGQIAGEYPSQAQALDRAFELCPDR